MFDKVTAAFGNPDVNALFLTGRMNDVFEHIYTFLDTRNVVTASHVFPISREPILKSRVTLITVPNTPDWKLPPDSISGHFAFYINPTSNVNEEFDYERKMLANWHVLESYIAQIGGLLATRSLNKLISVNLELVYATDLSVLDGCHTLVITSCIDVYIPEFQNVINLDVSARNNIVKFATICYARNIICHAKLIVCTLFDCETLNLQGRSDRHLVYNSEGLASIRDVVNIFNIPQVTPSCTVNLACEISLIDTDHRDLDWIPQCRFPETCIIPSFDPFRPPKTCDRLYTLAIVNRFISNIQAFTRLAELHIENAPMITKLPVHNQLRRVSCNVRVVNLADLRNIKHLILHGNNDSIPEHVIEAFDVITPETVDLVGLTGDVVFPTSVVNINTRESDMFAIESKSAIQVEVRSTFYKMILPNAIDISVYLPAYAEPLSYGGVDSPNVLNYVIRGFGQSSGIPFPISRSLVNLEIVDDISTFHLDNMPNLTRLNCRQIVQLGDRRDSEIIVDWPDLIDLQLGAQVADVRIVNMMNIVIIWAREFELELHTPRDFARVTLQVRADSTDILEVHGAQVHMTGHIRFAELNNCIIYNAESINSLRIASCMIVPSLVNTGIKQVMFNPQMLELPQLTFDKIIRIPTLQLIYVVGFSPVFPNTLAIDNVILRLDSLDECDLSEFIDSEIKSLKIVIAENSYEFDLTTIDGMRSLLARC